MIFSDIIHPEFIEKKLNEGMVNLLCDSCREANIRPELVGLVTEFGGGTGRQTRAIRQIFPGAKIQVIDREDRISEGLKADLKILFNQGSFIDVLESGVIEPADVVLFYHTGDKHGFNSNNIDLLARAVGSGILITGGHVGSLFTDSFLEKFIRVAQMNKDGMMSIFVWRVK